jgi:CBS domain containing-hemolysin-like protein
MRPRTQFRTFKPPVTLESLGGERTPSGYVLITDANGHEPASAVDLSRLGSTATADLRQLSEPVEVVPWCATIADALNKLTQANRRVAVVVNEFGETIGVITWDDILEAILQVQDNVSQRDLAKAEIKDLGDGVWQATGMTKLRRLERVIGRRIDASGSLTVGGVIHENLRRLPENGDSCFLDGLRLEIVQTAARGEMLVQITEATAADMEDEQ